MDDRTTIAKDVLCAMLASERMFDIAGVKPATADDWCNIAVAFADGVIARTAKPQPTPQPASKGVRDWFTMDVKPEKCRNVLVCDLEDSGWGAIWYWRSSAMQWCTYPSGIEIRSVSPSLRWTEIPRPTEADE